MQCQDCTIFGHDLRRPIADYLEDGIYELRIKHRRLHYRILYSFVGQQIVLLTHGIIKEQRIPPKEIQLARERREKWQTNPKLHTYEGDL
ncbi:MAG: type II toxin-antitoxin system RelE/ParE family toxin [Planctomycetaceae bacterium]|nr:type II toxin-antitoxin system RelE/ParE family toxin [Planctomycetaceae bacterium]